jgi:PAS domain S-box-containing protein
MARQVPFGSRGTHLEAGHSDRRQPEPMTDGTLPDADHLVDPLSRWPAVLAFAFILFALVALVVVPQWTLREVEAHRHQIEFEAEPARTHVRQSKTEIGRAAVALRSYLLTRDARSAQTFAEARARYQQLLAMLDGLVDRFDPAVAEQVRRVHVLLEQWHGSQDALLAGGDALAEEHELYEGVLVEISRLAELIVVEQADRRAAIRGTERLQRILLNLLAAITLVAAVVVTWLGWRYRSLMIAAERGRLASENSRRRLGALLWHNPDAAFELDVHGRILRVNPAAERLLALPAEELEGKHFPEIVASADRDAVAAAFHRALQGEAQHHDAAVRGADGRNVAVSITDIPIQVDRSVAGVYRVLEDVAAEREAQEKMRFLAEAGRTLAASLDYEQTLSTVARLAVPHVADWCVVDVLEDGQIRRLSVAHVEPEKEALAWDVVRRYPPDPDAPTGVAQVLRTGEPQLASEVSEKMLRRASRDEEHFRIYQELGLRSFMIVPMVTRGRTLGAITLISAESGRGFGQTDLDLAEELATRGALAVANARLFRQAEQSRGEAERRARQEAALRSAAQAMTASFSVEEVIQRIAANAVEAANADGAFVKRVDIERNEVVVVATAGKLVPSVGSRGPFPGSHSEIVLASGEPLLVPNLAEVEHAVYTEVLQSCRNCAAMVLPLIDAGEAIGTLVLTRLPERHSFRPDETERARTFADLASLAFRRIHLLQESEQRREELESVIESRARLIRGFSHDLKNPLGAADGFLDLIESGVISEPEKLELSIGRARRAIRASLGLIEDLTELARVEAGHLEVDAHAVDVREVARELVEEYRAQAEARGIEIDCGLPDELPVITSDSTRIRQILGNLVSNAVKYTAEGRVDVTVQHRAGAGEAGPGDWMAIDVADTGAGIPAEKQHLLFREFSRLAPETAPGVGLGLAISQRIAGALGGCITVTSEVGRGSVFTLWLPHRRASELAQGS